MSDSHDDAVKKPELPNDINCDDITIEEKIPSKIMKDLPQFVAALDRLDKSGISNMMIEGQKNYSGPLPYQLLENLTPAQGDKLIDDLVLSKKRNDENQRFFMEKMFESDKNDRNQDTFKYVFSAVIGVSLVCILIFTGNVPIIDKYLPYLVMFIGGTGFALYNVNKKKRPLQPNKNDGDEETE